ncbi:MAG: ATP-binding cassette domain-containing protein [Alphaproteobacteria bacterium]
MPEGRRMFAELTVRDNLLLGAYPRRTAAKAVLRSELDQVIAEFPWLGRRLDQLAGTLSGGEQQMVAMARAWLRKPRILCIDEPSMGLSPAMVDRVYEILARWKAAGLTILMVEQSANRALELVDRAYVLKNGAIDLAGAAADLIADPAVQEAYLGRTAPAPGGCRPTVQAALRREDLA